MVNTYTDYKDSKIEWVGKIPEHWNVTSVGKVYEITLGKMLQPTQLSSKDEFVPYLKAMNVQDGYLKTDTIDKMYASRSDIDNLKILSGDLLVCEGGEVARSVVIKKDLDRMIFQNSLHRVRSYQNNDVTFLHYYLISLRNSGFVDILVNRATIAHFTKDKFKSLKMPLPGIGEQKEIMKFLNKRTREIEDLITRKEILINLLEEKRQSMITEAVTKGLNPNVKMKDSGVEWIGEIPEHWEVKRVKHIAAKGNYSLVDGPFGSDLKNEEYKDEGVPIIQLNNIRNGEHLFNNIKYVTEEKSRQLSKHTAVPGDLVIAKMAHPVGRSAIVKRNFEKYVIVADCIKLSLDKNYYNRFINYTMNTAYFISQAELVAGGITRLRINLGDLKQLKLFIPPYQEQLEICGYLDVKVRGIDNSIALVTEQIQKLKDYRQSLIYEAVTGKIDVRDFEVES